MDALLKPNRVNLIECVPDQENCHLNQVMNFVPPTGRVTNMLSE